MSTTARPVTVRDRLPLAAALTASAVSTAGNAVTLVAVPLHVLQTTGSAALTGLAGFCATAPVVLGGTLGGVLVDRLGHRRASIAADLASGTTVAAVPLLHASTGLPLWVLLVLVALGGLLDVPGQAARWALLPELSAVAGVPLERATALTAAAERGARMLGAPAGGALVVLLGAPGALAVDAVTFGLSALLVARCVPATTAAPGLEPGQRDGYLRELAEGVAVVAREPLLRALVLLLVGTNLLDTAKLTVLLPVHATERLADPAALGLLVGAFSGGALLGSLLWAAVGHRLPRRAAFTTAFLLCGAPPYAALWLDLPLPALVVVLVLTGAAAGPLNPVIDAVLLERTPAAARARVVGLVAALCWLAGPLGPLLAGAAVSAAGSRPVLLGAGVAYLLLTLAPLRGGPWRGLRRDGVR
ncbi:MFS transporter [Kineococcus glutinatus]|uniref:Multidrug efflux pump Tap n=1 Tax=Kineococcus glutinatus TaxID=1070872 RepID=A0ABP9H8R9_9ACTN